jgi:hypothetical protein
MRRITLAVSIILVSLVLVNCGAEKLTPEKAKETIDKEMDSLVQKVVESKKGETPEGDLKKIKETVSKIKQAIKVIEIKHEETAFIAKVEMSVWEESVNVEMKFSKGDESWQIDAVKLPDVQWMTKNEVIERINTELATAIEMGKIKATMIDMKAIGSCIEDYILDFYKSPEAESFAELEKLLSPFYIKVLPLTDAWGNPFHYYHGTGDDKDNYAIGSGGSDGKFDGFDQKGTYTDIYGKDIIFSNGKFTFVPATK